MLPICSKTLLPASPGSQTFGRGGGCHVAVSSLRQANARLLMVQERGPSSAYRRQWYNGTSRDLVTKSLISQSMVESFHRIEKYFFCNLDFILFDWQINRNTLTLRNANKQKHEGMYQCAATNVHGSSLSAAQIRVLCKEHYFFCLNPECTSVRYCSLLNLFLI